MAGVLSIVVPCFNEEAVLNQCLNELDEILKSLIADNVISSESHILFVDDGSSDKTWELIDLFSKSSARVRGIKLSRNKGHQTALWAGLNECKLSDLVISIDADLQDDTSVIKSMVYEYNSGIDIVYGVRKDRGTDTFFKRTTANLFYKLMSSLGVHQVENHADFRLLSQRALLSLLSHQEKNIYIRGLIPLLGYSSTEVYYSRKERVAGESKYPLGKMLALALEGITSLSVVPLRVLTILGFLISVLSFFLILYSFSQYVIGHTVHGWTSVILAVLFIGGVQMLCIGVLGEYVGKIYIEVKNRPRFFLDKKTKN
ncbi:glycosyltransferase family 2 protein [Atlantibacter hermannii]|uniref:Bactoprenol glucosyltransferase homolog YfdH n=1 Tax=Atlantibacter hermannii NBRC 105704 TaxID=1115512 RepID=H5V0Q6_ATLHE|nr:glycosyltransferase family 2 protein [Atlantibacter hermannii]QPS93093.1 glycosyltransferase family 2 protein [Atlantibacter hermannii]GAB51564.1 bactoprenol glucosyltransferase homolog YfdH [Atlantibacter hermannii NBRC 105704]VDZ74205.1 bactoprenol glucosyl transferase; CPS-53 (KpLE1) prophage [Atlantibacter hermannii]